MCVWVPPHTWAAEAKQSSITYAPVGGQVTSKFGWRVDPVHGGNRFHSGLDIAAPSGTPIYSPQNGRILFSGYYKGYGNCVVIDHGYNLYTLYGHASALYVSSGDGVYHGQPIAAVGSTGRSTGPHLHFEVHQRGQYVDPLHYLAYLGKAGQSIATGWQRQQQASSGRLSVSLAKNTDPMDIIVSSATSEIIEPQRPENQQGSGLIEMRQALQEDFKQRLINHPQAQDEPTLTTEPSSSALTIKISPQITVSKVTAKSARKSVQAPKKGTVQLVSGKSRQWVHF